VQYFPGREAMLVIQWSLFVPGRQQTSTWIRRRVSMYTAFFWRRGPGMKRCGADNEPRHEGGAKKNQNSVKVVKEKNTEYTTMSAMKTGASYNCQLLGAESCCGTVRSVLADGQPGSAERHSCVAPTDAEWRRLGDWGRSTAVPICPSRRPA
jgi:hypothetical protein